MPVSLIPQGQVVVSPKLLMYKAKDTPEIDRIEGGELMEKKRGMMLTFAGDRYTQYFGADAEGTKVAWRAVDLWGICSISSHPRHNQSTQERYQGREQLPSY